MGVPPMPLAGCIWLRVHFSRQNYPSRQQSDARTGGTPRATTGEACVTRVPMHTWQIPLSAKPAVRQIASYRLGQRPVERWRLLNFWAIHLYRQEAVFIVDGRAFPIRARSVSITPPVVDLEYRIPGPLDYLYAHFVFPQGPHLEVPIPVVTELGKDFEKMYEAL